MEIVSVEIKYFNHEKTAHTHTHTQVYNINTHTEVSTE